MSEVYDEFSHFRDNAEEVGLDWAGPPVVERISVPVDGERRVSGLRWGHGAPRVVLFHGGAQNAHTWDTVLLALDEPALALDLPGHGHSDWRGDHRYSPQHNARDLANALDVLAPDADLVVGMSLGGLTSFCLAADRPDLVTHLGVVDVTPGTDHAKAEPIVTFINGPEVFGSFQEILDRTMAFNPTRSESSLRRGILHNARENADGTWTWRWDPVKHWELAADDAAAVDFTELWDRVSEVRAPITLFRGGAEGSVVVDEDEDELRRRQPDVEVVTVDGAGHSIQGDRPLVLAEELRRLLA